MKQQHTVTEKIQSTQQGHKMSHNVGTRLFSGFLVSFASGVDNRNCWMKQQSNTHIQGHLWLSKLADTFLSKIPIAPCYCWMMG